MKEQELVISGSFRERGCDVIFVQVKTISSNPYRFIDNWWMEKPCGLFFPKGVLVFKPVSRIVEMIIFFTLGLARGNMPEVSHLRFKIRRRIRHGCTGNDTIDEKEYDHSHMPEPNMCLQ